MSTLNRIFTVLALLCLPIAGHAQESVRLQLKWGHQFQFAGYYAAVEQGYYAEEGLEVELIPASPSLDPINEVLEGRAEFGVGTSDLLLRHHEGEPVVVLAVIFQHSPLVLLSTSKKNVNTLHDIDGQRVAIEPASAELFAYLKREGVKPDQIDIVQHSHSLSALIQGEVAAQSVYVTTEPFELDKLAIPYQVYSPRSAGIDFYGDNLFTTHAELGRHPERVEAFRRASLRGWLYAMSHTEEVIDLILRTYPTKRNREALRYEADMMQQLMRTDLIDPGHMIPGRWQHMADIYAEMGMLPDNISLDNFLYHSEPEPIDLGRIYLILGLNGLLAAIFAVMATYLMQYNRRLKRSERKFRTVFDNAPLAFVVSDSQGIVRDWNIAATHIFGWSRDEVLGCDLFNLIVERNAQSGVREVLKRTIREKETIPYVNTNITRTGKHITCEWVNSLYVSESKDKEELLLSVGSDVTERIMLEQSLRKARDAAQEALEDQKRLLSKICG